MSVQPGKYKARAIGGYKGTSKVKGTPFIEVTFQIDGTEDTVKWTGYLTDKTEERTKESLAISGWNGEVQSDNEILASSFDPSANPMITVVEEDYTDQEGNPKTITKVAWVNQPGSGRYEAEPEVIKKAFAGFDFKAEMAAAKAKLGIVTPKKKTIKNHAPGAINEDESIPF